MKNRTIIVTGGARDIGRSVTLALARAGANVVMNYHGSVKEAEKTLALAREMAPQTMPVQADVTTDAGVKKIVAQTREAFGDTIHGLVNVAGGLVERRTLPKMDAAFLEHVMRLNMTSTFLMTAAVVPHMQKGASIVNLASQAARDGGGMGASAYAASKGAVLTFTRSMAKELGPSGIRVNALSPGMISTTFHDVFTSPEVRAKVAGGTPLQREGAPDEVASVVTFLLSDAGAFVTGACIDVNGGTIFS